MEARSEPYYPDVGSPEEIIANQFDEIQKISWQHGMPDPTYWRLLVAPTLPPKISRGGIWLPDASQDAAEYLNFIGKILRIGPLTGVHRRLQHPDPESDAGVRRPKVGDWICFARFANLRFSYRGIRLLLVDEESILGFLDEGPEGYRIYT